jgi:hypothetical protein
MNQLPVNPLDRNAADSATRRRRESASALICRWRRDPVTGALSCFWTTRGASRDSTLAAPLRRAS